MTGQRRETHWIVDAIACSITDWSERVEELRVNQGINVLHAEH